MLLNTLKNERLIGPPSWLVDNTHYLCMMGSIAYGVSKDQSDVDVYGWCIPPKRYVFPHTEGYLPGFSKNIPSFEQWFQHHIKRSNNKEYDVTVYSIVKYFRLCMDNNPNMIDSLFVPARCILHISSIGSMVRSERTLFLHKGSFHKFRGYLWSQLNKAKKIGAVGKRKKDIDRLGYCPKFLYHVVRLASELEQILREGTLVLDEKGRREHMKAIRDEIIGYDEVVKWFEEKDRILQKLYETSSLPHSPPEDKIKDLLLRCLEEHYGNIDSCVIQSDKYKVCIDKVRDILNEVL